LQFNESGAGFGLQKILRGAIIHYPARLVGYDGGANVTKRLQIKHWPAMAAGLTSIAGAAREASL